MPVFVVGSILFGVVTPTEAASFAVAYALIVGLFLLREIKWTDLPRIFGRSMRDTAVIMIIMSAVAAANWLLTYNRIPNMITDFALEFMTAKWMFLISSMALFLFAGLFLEGIAAMLVLVPILHPIAVSMGVDPIHFGILVVFNLMIGLITPPMGLCLFVADAVANVGLGSSGPSDHPIVFRGAFCVDRYCFFSGGRHRSATLVGFLGRYQSTHDID